MSAHEMAVEVSGLTKSFGRVHALRGLDLDVPDRSGHGVPRPERLGQVHDDPHPARAAARRRRPGERAGRRPVGRRGPAAPLDRLRAGRRHAVAQPHRRRGDRHPVPAVRLARPAAQADDARAVRARPDQEGPRLLQGQPAEGRPRRRARLARRAAAARRADLRPRPAHGGGVHRVDPRGQGRGPLGAAVQPHLRRGREAGRPGDDHPRRRRPSRPARSPSCGT